MKANKKMRKMTMEVSLTLKALAHPQRLLILCYLLEGEKSVSEISAKTELSQSQTSQFLIRMQKEGVLTSKKAGNFSMYALSDKKIRKLILSLDKIFCS